ncbi:hypothetical protein D7B24_000367 [Verticillium nonalfalfae]|nr:uncharacterized protein D7B24_000367 [Verticillium nonalfalfae]RNJ54524.1 hypothetical protein D7B24_000367 [Verticillium nonalfalfae]
MKVKIKCDRHNPCSKCRAAKVDCSYPSGGERSRPASKKHVQALESQVSSLELFIQDLASADDATRSRLLAGISSSSPPSYQPHPQPASQPLMVDDHVPSAALGSPSESGDLVLARAREGRMCKLAAARKASQFYGGTSLFMQLSETTPPNPQQLAGPSESPEERRLGPDTETTLNDNMEYQAYPFQPKDETCRQLMATFFQTVYQYNMCVYREYFLRDYHAESGPYYSDTLMFSICAVGASISKEPALRALLPVFLKRAGAMVFESLELPDLTTLQSLIILGHLEIGQGRSSKGWLFCGMAFRLTHEMGLHLDPGNWTNSKSESSVDREILRRVYWAVFIVDKQMSLYFGRPPALYPHEADVRNTIRIPYPPEWESLLDSYISKSTSSTAFEDGLATVSSFTHQAELAKIFHVLIVDVFENRLRQTCATKAAATAQQVHTSLVKWLATLPQKLHWNQWTVGQVPPYVLHLHMVFHTGMIILHRPPRQQLDDDAIAASEGVETLPLDFVHTLSAAAEVVMMKRFLEKSTWDDKDISKPLAQILDAMEAVQSVYPCMRGIRDSILENIKSEGVDEEAQQHQYGVELELMDLLQSAAAPFPGAWGTEDAESATSADLGFLLTDDFLNQHYSWDNAGL